MVFALIVFAAASTSALFFMGFFGKCELCSESVHEFFWSFAPTDSTTPMSCHMHEDSVVSRNFKKIGEGYFERRWGHAGVSERGAEAPTPCRGATRATGATYWGAVSTSCKTVPNRSPMCLALSSATSLDGIFLMCSTCSGCSTRTGGTNLGQVATPRVLKVR